MAFDFLVAHWWLPILSQLEGYADVAHLLGNGVGPEGCVGSCIYGQGFLNGVWQLDAKLVCCLPVP